MDLERLARSQKSFLTVPCPACDVGDGKFIFEKYGFTFDKCPHCGTAYMNPRASPEVLADFYAHSAFYEYWNQYIFPATRDARKEYIFRPRVGRISEHCKHLGIKSDVMIKVGSASGMFCEEALASGSFRQVIGIEPGEAQAATCREKGIEVIESTIESVDNIGELADIVVSFETIEH